MGRAPESAPRSAVDLCAPFLAALPVRGASVAIVVASGARVTLCSSDSTAARIDELQFELGEGPQWAALRTGQVTTITDTRDRADPGWPMFGAALAELSVGAVFCIPIRMGAVTLGVVTLYCEVPREFTGEQETTGLAIAAVLAGTAADLAMTTANDHSEAPVTSTLPALRREVHQATGVILVQLNISATDAYARLQAYAFANGRTVEAVAHDVVAGSLTFVDDFDVVALLHWLVEECTEILDAEAGGLMLVNAAGVLQLVASTSEEANLVEIFHLAAGDGPCLECFRTGTPVTVGDLETEGGRWGRFSTEAVKLGFYSVHATPLRLRGQVIGTMNLFGQHKGPMGPEDIAVAQALADVATGFCRSGASEPLRCFRSSCSTHSTRAC